VPGDVGSGWSTVAMADQDATIVEGDEPREPASDNSNGRLLALSDGVFAIAMTLLALDLRLPDLGAPSERRAIAPCHR
jgi:Endosomal/lysosomal potassium channel TMEM175